MQTIDLRDSISTLIEDSEKTTVGLKLLLGEVRLHLGTEADTSFELPTGPATLSTAERARGSIGEATRAQRGIVEVKPEPVEVKPEPVDEPAADPDVEDAEDAVREESESEEEVEIELDEEEVTAEVLPKGPAVGGS